ncbi:MAG: hypothetical protein OEY49_16375 [Candidatus Heimdallarchaeota archaeon]|nr:hypothetical protein [Candidatus Heimdallarchaeota archaeon]
MRTGSIIILTEVYLLKEGVNVFHYAKDKNLTTDHAILSSGLFSAIRQFSESTRSSAIDFLASKDEIFIYDIIENTDLIIICIFENNIQQSVAREIIHEIKTQMKKLEVKKLLHGDMLDPKKANRLTKTITDTAKNLLSVEYQVVAAKEIFEEQVDLSYLLLYDYKAEKIHFFESFNVSSENQVRQFDAYKQIQKTFTKLISSQKLGKNFRTIVVIGENFSLSINKYKSVFNVAYSDNNLMSHEILELPFKIMSLPSFTDYEKNFDNLPKRSSWILDRKSKLKTNEGEPPYWDSAENIINALTSIESLIVSFEKDGFDEIKIFIDEPRYKQIIITKNYMLDQKIVEMYYD